MRKEDVVAGLRTPRTYEKMEEMFPDFIKLY